MLTDGWALYVRMRRGVYHLVDRQGRRTGTTCSGFRPRPRWRPARVCSYDRKEHGLTCPRCYRYDTHYAKTGERSFCGDQRSATQRALERRALGEDLGHPATVKAGARSNQKKAARLGPVTEER